MDSETSSMKIEQLKESNYHAWKIRIQHVLTLKGLKKFIIQDPPERTATNLAQHESWEEKDAKAQAVIGLTLSDELLENVREVASAKEMWTAIRNVFERHTLLNKLSARRKFYTAAMEGNESVLKFANRIRQLAASLKSMNVDIPQSEMAMALLNGLPQEYNALISALDAVEDDDAELDWEFVKSRVMQEEQRINMRAQSAIKNSETSALVSKQFSSSHCSNCSSSLKPRPHCSHCNKVGHFENKCWVKFPHLNPRNKKNSENKPALIASGSTEDPVICLMAKYEQSTEPTKSGNWYIDSGCSNHMTYDKDLFSSYSSGSNSSVELGNNNVATVSGSGSVDLTLLVDNKPKKCRLSNVLHVPDLGYQLLSVTTLDKSGLKISFYSRKCQIMKNNTLIATGSMIGNLYRLDSAPNIHNRALVTRKIELWHHRLAHISPRVILEMSNKNMVRGLDDVRSFESFHCSDCLAGKGHRSPIPRKSKTRASKLLELVHSDVNGPLETPSLGGARYFVTFIDDFSKWTFVYTMKQKSETFTCFKKFHKLAERHTGLKIDNVNVITRSNPTPDKLKTLRTDNGGEYLSNEFRDYLAENGIQHQLTVAYTPQQNGVAERMNRTIMDLVRSMLHSSGLPKEFWGEAVATAVYIRNRVSSQTLPVGTTPYHRWMGKSPDLSYIRIFGCKCWFVIPKIHTNKLDRRSKPGIMLGYSTQSKGYKIWDTEAQTIIVSRDVKFDESSFSSPISTLEDADEASGSVKVQGGEVANEVTIDTDPPNSVTETEVHTFSEEEFQDSNTEPTPALRRSTRISKPPGEWYKATGQYAQALSAQTTPTSYQVAVSPENIDFWKPGIDREHDCITRNNTWTLVERKSGMHVLPSKYVFKVKDGKPKVRLVAMGCRQIHGVDYNETFAPVVSLTTIRTILALASHYDLELEQMDVVTAFLNGDLHEDIYMTVPDGFKNPSNSNQVCKLQKSLYGLKQSPRQWYAKMHSYLVEELGFQSSKNDPCLYVNHDSASLLLIGLYVDDLLIAGSNKKKIHQIKKELTSRFEMKDLGAARVMLGIEITRDRANRQLLISQSEYTLTILARFGMENSRSVATPMDRPGSSTTENNSAVAVPYRQAIGSLMYLMIGSRPDIAFAVGRLSQHAEHPSHEHWVSVKRVFRYINGTRDFGILYDGNRPLVTEGYADADWAGCRESRKSTSGNIFLVAGGAVCWRSKKQTCVATSTCEAEYIACCLAAKEAVWLSRLLADLTNSKNPQPITINVDNIGAIDTAYNASINQKNKHIDIAYHFVRDCIMSGKLKLTHCNSGDQAADPLTKSLERVLHERLRLKQGLCSKPISN